MSTEFLPIVLAITAAIGVTLVVAAFAPARPRLADVLCEAPRGSGGLWEALLVRADRMKLTAKPTDLALIGRFRESFPGFLRPGWVLQLPHDDHADCEEIVVRPGQTLSQIAREELGDAGRYREIFDFNRGRPQPDGHLLADPDTIRPGDFLRIPRPPPPASGGGGAPAAAAFHRAPVRDSCQTSDSPPTPPAQQAKPPPGPRAPTSTSAPPAQARPSSDTDDSATVTVGLGGLLAAGLLTLLAIRRRRARQRRRPGHRIRGERPGEFEATLHSAAKAGTVDDLDRALRTLARHAEGDLPKLRAVKVGADGCMLLPAGERKPVAPFVKTGPDEWKLDPSAVLDGDAELPPYPALVSLGHTVDRALLLIDLREAGVVSLAGDREAAEAVVLAMAWDLAVAPWAAQVQITLVGTGRTSAERHPDRLRFAADWEDAISSLKARSGRTRVLLSAIPLNEDVAQRLLRCGPDAIVTADGEGISLPGAWCLDVEGPRTLVETLGVVVELQRLSAAQVDELVVALADADEPVQVPADYRNVPAGQPVELLALPSLEVSAVHPRLPMCRVEAVPVRHSLRNR